jgi:6-phosphogluconolactonase
MKPEIVIADPPDLAREFARRLSAALRQAAAGGRACGIALPGGSVAETFLPVLAAAGSDWRGAAWFWGDERAVPPDHPDSNYGLAKRLLLDRIRPDPLRVHRMPGEAADLEAAARACEAMFVEVLGEAAALDVALLGVGPDGHVCSLFPGHPALGERGRRVVAVTDSPKPPPRRLTLTRAALAAARTVVVAAFGETKAEVIREAAEDPQSMLPVALVLREAREALLLLDPAAARLLASGR